MERADWLEERVNAADARFLMVTAITHHRFSSPIWGAREVRKLHAELAEIAKHASEVLKERPGRRQAQEKEEAAPDAEVPRRLRRPGLAPTKANLTYHFSLYMLLLPLNPPPPPSSPPPPPPPPPPPSPALSLPPPSPSPPPPPPSSPLPPSPPSSNTYPHLPPAPPILLPFLLPAPSRPLCPRSGDRRTLRLAKP